MSSGAGVFVIVIFGIVSTLTLLVHQRRPEMALLASVGATPEFRLNVHFRLIVAVNSVRVRSRSPAVVVVLVAA